MVHHIAPEKGRFTFRGKGEREMIMAVAWRADDSEPRNGRGVISMYPLIETGRHDRLNAVGKDAVARIPDVVRIGVKLVFGFRKQITRVRESRHPAAILQPRIPADMINVQM